jgi:hypothetical protein
MTGCSPMNRARAPLVVLPRSVPMPRELAKPSQLGGPLSNLGDGPGEGMRPRWLPHPPIFLFVTPAEAGIQQAGAQE